jgi:hypothetical protein
VSDGFAETQPATYSIQVVRRKSSSEAQDQTIATTVGERVSFALNVTDPDDDPMRTVILKGPANGLLFGSGTNFTYVPNVGSIGSDSFTTKGGMGRNLESSARDIAVSLPREQLPPLFRSITQKGNAIELILEVPNTNAFYIDISTNLVDWTAGAGPFISPQESFSYKDTNRTDAVRFYRCTAQQQ